ncbi:PKD domain-containing protein, partial [Methanophagales archaeon]
ESNESNNEFLYPIPEVPFADLTVTDITYSPSTIMPGETVIFITTVENVGASTKRDFHVRFEIDGSYIGRKKILGGLASDSSARLSWSWTASSGTHTVKVIADEYDTVTELNEDNNSKTESLPLVPAPPEVVVKFPNGGETLDGVQNITWNASSLRYGDELAIKIEVYNGSYIPIADNITNTGYYLWNTTGVEDGSYLLRVTATDADGLSASDFSDGWFTICNLFKVRLFSSSNQTTVKGVNATYTLSIFNDQPFNDTFNISIENIDNASVAELASDRITIPAWSSKSLTLNVTDETQGTYQVKINVISETNANISGEIVIATRVIDEFTVDVTTDKSIYDRGEQVVISGDAKFLNGSSVQNASVEIEITVKGYRRTFFTSTDESGNYEYRFKPAGTEAGIYSVNIASNYEGVVRTAQTSFTIIGLYLSPQEINLEMSQNSSHELSLSLTNIGETSLTGIEVNVLDNNPTDSVTAVVNVPETSLMPDESMNLAVNISAGSDTFDAQFDIEVSTAQNATEECSLRVKLRKALPAAVVTPSSVELGMNPGKNVIKKFTIRNVGYGTMENVSLIAPSLPWINITTPLDIGNIPPRGEASFEVSISPEANQSAGIYQDVVKIESTNHKDITAYLTITVTPKENGSLNFRIKDVVNKSVPSANVFIQHQAVPTITYSSVTNTEGEVSFTDIPAGTYTYRISPDPSHYPASGSVEVEPGQTKNVDTVLDVSFVDTKWSVTPVKIGDYYVTTLEITFETDVPIPQLCSVPSALWFNLEPGGEGHSQLALENLGLISVFNVTLSATSTDKMNISFLSDYIEEIPAKQVSAVIPAKVEVSPDAKQDSILSGWINVEGDYIFVDGNWTKTGKVKLSIPVYVFVYCKGLNLEIDPPALMIVKRGANLSFIECDEEEVKVKNVGEYPVFLSDIAGGLSISTLSGLTLNVGDFDKTDLAVNETATLHVARIPVIIPEDVQDVLKEILSSAIPSASVGTITFSGSWANPGLTTKWYTIPIGEISYGIPGGDGKPWNVTVPDIRLDIDGPRPPPPSPFLPSPKEETVHEVARLTLSQDIMLEREAFNARLEVESKVPELEDVHISIEIEDCAGNRTNSLFHIKEPELSGIDTIDGGNITRDEMAVIEWLIVPGSEAVSDEEKTYKVMATMSYQVEGERFIVNTSWEEITVVPEPRLNLTYYLPERVKAGVPFELRLVVENIGNGTAHNLRIKSAQPKIESESGLLVDFTITGCELEGEEIAPSLMVNFGDIAPGASKTACWEMVSSMDGNFTGFDASFTHEDPYGLNLESLIEGVSAVIVKPEAWSFAIITDLHIGYHPDPYQQYDYGTPGWNDNLTGDPGKDEYYLTKRLRAVVGRIRELKNEQNIKFVVVLGDITDTAEKSEFLKAREILNELNDVGIPYIPMIGNHDIWPYTQKPGVDPDDRKASCNESDMASDAIGDEFFEEVFWNTSDEEIKRNIELIEALPDWEKESTPIYSPGLGHNIYLQNYAFTYGGINFVFLDYVARDAPPGSGGIFAATTGLVGQKCDEWKNQYRWKKGCTMYFSHHPDIVGFPRGSYFFAGHIHDNAGRISKGNKRIRIESISREHGGLMAKTATHSGYNIRIVQIDGEKIDDILEKPAKDYEPMLFFTYSPGNPEPNQDITFRGTSGGKSYKWDFGNGETKTTTTPEILYSYPGQGKYTVTLTVTWKDLTTGTIKKGIEVKYKYTLRNPPAGLTATSIISGEDVTKNPQNTPEIVKITRTAPEEKPITDLIVHFENATEDIDLTNLTADTNLTTRKTVLYMPEWPSVIEESKILYIPSTGKGAVYICKNATNLEEVSLENADLVINVGETIEGITVATTLYNDTEYYAVFNITGTGGGEAPSQHPFASFTYTPENATVNETITFNASSSYDPDGNITNYEWDFGDGNVTNTTEETINHSYSEAGSYEVTLTVTDNDGATNSTTKIITVYPPAAIFDTGTPSNPYPSIAGTHNGTITPNKTIIATKLYTY